MNTLAKLSKLKKNLKKVYHIILDWKANFSKYLNKSKNSFVGRVILDWKVIFFKYLLISHSFFQFFKLLTLKCNR